MRGAVGLSAINVTPPRRKGLLRRYTERRNRYIVERRLPRFSERPFDWSTNSIHTLLYKVGFGHIGKLAVVAAYFILTQTLTGQHTTIFGSPVTLPDVKGTWDHLLSRTAAHGGLVQVMSQHAWNPLRHLIRAVYEGIFGILLFRQIGYNVLKVRAKDKATPSGLDRFFLRFMPFVANKHQGHPITPLQYVALPFVVTIASAPGVAIGYGILYALVHVAHATWLSPHLQAHPSLTAKFYSENYGAVLVGVFAGLTRLVRYVTNPVLRSNTVYFARRRVARNKKGAWWHPPAYRLFLDDLARNADAQERAQAALAARSNVATAFLIGGWIVIFGLAAYGYYVIRYVA